MGSRRYDVALINRRGLQLERVAVVLDIRNDSALQGHLDTAMQRQRQPARKRNEFSLQLYAPGNRRPLTVWSPV